MVVKNEKSVEGIKEILRRLEVFFATQKAQETDSKTLVNMERELTKMECNLQTFSDYRRNPER